MTSENTTESAQGAPEEPRDQSPQHLERRDDATTTLDHDQHNDRHDFAAGDQGAPDGQRPGEEADEAPASPQPSQDEGAAEGAEDASAEEEAAEGAEDASAEEEAAEGAEDASAEKKSLGDDGARDDGALDEGAGGPEDQKDSASPDGGAPPEESPSQDAREPGESSGGAPAGDKPIQGTFAEEGNFPVPAGPDRPQESTRRRRRVTTAAVTPQAAPEAVQPVLTHLPESSPAEGESEQRRASALSGPAAPQPEPSQPEPSEAEEQRAPSRRRRRRVVAAATAPATAPAAEQPALAPSGQRAPGQGAESTRASDQEAPAPTNAGPAASDPAAGDADDSAEGTEAQGDSQDPAAEEEPAQEAPRLPAASLLFQTPDPSRARRRRRVVAAATAPATAPAAEQSPLPELDAQPGPQAAEEQGGAEGTPARSRRRRRKATAAPSTPEHVEQEPPAHPPAEDQDQEKAQEKVEDGEQEAAQPQTEAQEGATGRRKRRRGGRGRRSRSRTDSAEATPVDTEAGEEAAEEQPEEEPGSSRRRRRRSRSRTEAERDVRDEVTALKGSTRLEAKRQRRREGRAAGRRRPIVTEAEFLARRESVDRQMIVREQDGLNQIAVLEDGLLVEHYVARHTQTSMVGNVYIGRVQNVLPSMEAAFVDLGKGRNAVLYAGEVNWDAAGMEGKPRRIEDALKSGDTVLVQVTKDPIGHKGARLTSQITLAGRYLVLVPGGTMTGISRKLPDTERARLKKILKKVVPDFAGVIVRTAAEGASEEQLAADVARLAKQWEAIDKKSTQVMKGSGKAPVLLKGEPELAVRVVRDVFNEDFRKLVVSGAGAWKTISDYVTELSPDLAGRLEHWVGPEDVFAAHRVDEQLAKGFDRKVWLPSGGTLIIDRTEAMTVIDVNTGRFTGAGGTLEETVTRNNLEAAEEIVRQLRLRDIGGMVVIDFVDMVLESNRDLVLRRLVECLGRDRTRHQVTEVTSLGLVQMTRKRVGQGLVEAFSTPCECCGGRGFILHDAPVENQGADLSASASRGPSRGRGRKSQEAAKGSGRDASQEAGEDDEPAGRGHAARAAVRGALAQIAAAAENAHKDAPAPS